jgi:uncharacterized protein YigE (DUF2233 family)
MFAGLHTVSLRALAACAMAVAGLASAPRVVWAAESAPCRDVIVEGKSYSVCTFDLRATTLRLHWKDASGEPYGNLGSLVRSAERGKGPLSFAMNAGMYHEGGAPVGLYIEGGQQLVKANTAGGPGNFHMKPNGVFYFTADEVGVMETTKFLKVKPKADFATQSGPMLVIDGKLHPKFSANGPSLKIRNGVGVRDAQTVVFAISNEGVSFGDFGRLFRDHLKCPNALFLDGSISSLHAPSVGRTDQLWPVGPIVSARVKGK